MSESGKIQQGYCVLIDDNYHYMDAEHRSHLAVYENYEDALERAKEITRKSVIRNKGTDPNDTHDNYTDFGSDPFIQAIGGAPEPAERFSAWKYAEVIAKEIHSELERPRAEGETS